MLQLQLYNTYNYNYIVIIYNIYNYTDQQSKFLIMLFVVFTMLSNTIKLLKVMITNEQITTTRSRGVLYNSFYDSRCIASSAYFL
jgi:hypothetical protein